MRHVLQSFVLAMVTASLFAMTGCASRPAPDFKGRWKPVNHYAETTMAIPLHQTYLFQPSPMDGTLKHMLERWTQDAKMQLSYRHASDFTLFAPVEQISTTSIEQAAAQLTAIYANQQVSVSIEGDQVVVRQADQVGAMPTMDEAAPASD